MSKATIGLGILGIGATTAVAAPLAMTWGGGSGESEIREPTRNEPETPANQINSQPARKSTWSGSKIPLLSSSEVKTEYSKIDCLKNFNGSQNKWGEDQIQSRDPEITLIDNDSEGLNGCLMVEYYKQENSDKTKWKGGFKLVWSISTNKQGVVASINVDAEKGKMFLDSSIYVIEESNSNWSLSYKDEGKSQEIADDSGLSNYFPKAGTSMNNGDQNEYWGFAPDINKICKGDECSNITTEAKTPTSKQWTWNKSDTNGTPITDWSSNLNNWFLKLFDKWGKVKEELEKLKGTWTQQTQQ